MNSRAKTTTIKVLSIQQPYVDLIFMGMKWCENRTWKTDFHGELFIHASSLDRAELEAWREAGFDIARESPLGCATGVIQGSVHLQGCVPVEDLRSIRRGGVPKGLEELAEVLRQANDESWDFVSGPWCWILTDPLLLEEEIAVKGKLRIWTHTVDADRLQMVEPEPE